MLDFRILGPMEVVGQEPLPIGGRKQQAVLAALLLHRGEVVSPDRLIEAVWGGRAPATASKTLQVYVSNLRKALGNGMLVTHGSGYMLSLQPEQVDSERFEALSARGRSALEQGDTAEARDRLKDALALWRGPALADFTYDSFAQPEIARLEEARMAALEARIEADLKAGRHAELVPELEALVHEHPLRERLYEHLMVALYRSGRQVEALDRYQRARRKLIDEFGIEPGPRLQQIQRAVLSQDATLEASDDDTARSRRRLRRADLGLTVGPRQVGALGIVAAGAALIALIVVLATSGGAAHKRGPRAHPTVALVKPQIFEPTSGGVYAQGEFVATRFTCPASLRGSRLVSCRDSGGAGGGSGRLDTAGVGAHSYSVVATFKGGAEETDGITYAVVPLRVSVDSGAVTAGGGRARIRLVCLGAGEGADCRGTVSLTRHGVFFGSARYSLRAGSIRFVGVRLKKRAKRALTGAAGHRLRVLLTVTQPFASSSHQLVTITRR